MSFNGGKRRRDEDDEEFQEHSHSRPQFQKRQRQELSPELQLAIKLCEDITKLGEKPLASLNNDINYMSFPISEEISESPEIRNALLKTFLAVIVEQPHKLPMLKALLQICNLRNSIVGKFVFEYLHKCAQELIDGLSNREGVEDSFSVTCGNLNKLKLILRFFAICSDLILEDGVFKLFEQFLQVAVDLSKAADEGRNGVAEALFYNVLLSIPYLQNNGEATESIDKLLGLAAQFQIVKVESSMYDHFDTTVVKFEKPYISKFLVELVLPAVRQAGAVSQFLNMEEWIAPLLEELKNYESAKHSLPQLDVSVSKLEGVELQGSIDSLWRNPRIVLEVYSAQVHDFETKPPIESYFGLLLNDICQDVIQNLEFNKSSVSQQLMIIDQFFQPKTFSKLGSSIDKLTILNDKKNGTVLEVDMEDPANGKIRNLLAEVDHEFAEGYLSTWKVEDVLTEALLNLIFNLPDVTNAATIYYYTVLVECCNKESKAMAPVFGRAIRFFFTNITILDFELRSRYLDWLAVQLSNFRFQWKWHEWTDYLKKLGDLKFHPIIIFIKNLIAKEIRLSSANKIKDTLPEDFYRYLDISLNDAAYIEAYDSALFGSYWESPEGSNLKFLEEGNDARELCSQIYEALSNAKHKEAVAIEAITPLIDSLKEQKDNKYVVNLVFQSCCVINSRSISHVKAFIETNSSVLKQVLETLDDEDREVYVIESVLRIWNHEPQVGFLILEMLLAEKLISWKSYVTQLFVVGDYAVISNISAVESLLRVLTNLELYNIEEAVFVELFGLIQDGLNAAITEGVSHEIENVEEEVDDQKWLYSELLKLMKSILRKFNRHYKDNVEELTASGIKVTDEETVAVLKGYLGDLQKMK